MKKSLKTPIPKNIELVIEFLQKTVMVIIQLESVNSMLINCIRELQVSQLSLTRFLQEARILLLKEKIF